MHHALQTQIAPTAIDAWVHHVLDIVTIRAGDPDKQAACG